MRGEIPQKSQYKTAELFSLDGVVFSSKNPFPFRETEQHFGVPPLEYIPPAIEIVKQEVPVEKFLPPNQIKSYLGQFACSVTGEMFDFLWSRNAEVFGNTGRPDSPPWWILTENTLRRGGVDKRFSGTFYAQQETDRVVSKGAAILAVINSGLYNPIIHYDNNPWVAIGLARAIPEASFVLVQNSDMRRRYNITQEKLSDIFGKRVTVTDALVYTDSDFGTERKTEPERVIYSYFDEQQNNIQ